MIFSAKNEKGEDLCDLVLAGRKTVTRRRTPKQISAILSVQRGRGLKGIAKIKVLSCELDYDWRDRLSNALNLRFIRLEKEAEREGFASWDGLWTWIKGHYHDKSPLYRIEFELVKK